MTENTEEFKILTARDHLRKRIGMYLGSVSKTETERFVNGVWKNTRVVPALFKCVNEIIDNSVDEAIRTNFKHANQISVSIAMNEIVVEDNGRGIPQDMIEDENVPGTFVPRPQAAWTRVNAGSSFNDDRVTIGANGVGSSAVNFVSSSFLGDTWRQGKGFIVECSDGANTIAVREYKAKRGSGTSVSFTPDYSLFETDSLEEDDLVDLVEDRVRDLQISFPLIEFRFNGNKVAQKTFKEHAKTYGEVSVIEQTDDLSLIITGSEDGFRHNSFVNGVNTFGGGEYVNFVTNGLIDELEKQIKKKHKIDVPKKHIKDGLAVIIYARNFIDPKFDSQTKERLTSTNAKTREHYVSSGAHDFAWLAKKIVAEAEIIDPIISQALAKKQAQDDRDAKKAEKQLKKIRVAKHIAASGPSAALHLVEGDSALGPSAVVRDPKKHGFFPLRGVLMNVWEKTHSQAISNKEISELVAVLGLSITDPNSWKRMHYRDIRIMSDADVDGGKIATLIVALFVRFWPGLVTDGRLSIIRSPVLISSKGKDVKWFYDLNEASDFIAASKGYEHRYIKGLGSLEDEEYRKVIHEPVLDVIRYSPENDKPFLDMMFVKDGSSERKTFMEGGGDI